MLERDPRGPRVGVLVPPASEVVLLRQHELDRVREPGVPGVAEVDEHLEVLEDVGDVAGREAELEPVRAHPGLGWVIGDRRVARQEERHALVDRAPHERGPPARRDERQPAQRLDRAPGTGRPTVDGAFEPGTGRPRPIPPLDPLAGDRPRLPVQRVPDPLVLQPPERDERVEDVAVQAVDRAAVGPVPAEPAVRGLGVVQDVGTGALDPAVARIGAELVEEHQRPDGAGVLRPVAGTRLDPVAVRVLGGECRGDRIRAHRSGPGPSDRGSVLGLVEQPAQGEVPHGGSLPVEQPRQRVAVQCAAPGLHRSSQRGLG